MKKIPARIALVSISVAMAMAACELGLRIAGFRQPAILPDAARQTYSTAPHAEFTYRGYLPGTFEDFENVVRLNQRGFHDLDYETNRPAPGTYRAMVLGDSYVAALSVPLEKTFHKRIEQRLRAEDPLKCGSYEVMAFGQGRVAQRVELNWLQELGPQYRPDVVLLVFFCGNDIMENSARTLANATAFADHYISEVLPRKQALFNRLLLFPHSRVNGILAEALTSFYAKNLYRFLPAMKKEDLISPELGVYRSPLAPEWIDAFSKTDALLQALHVECQRQGVDLMIACLEGPQAIGDTSENRLRERDRSLDLDQPARWLAGWCDTNHVPMCDLEPSLVKAGQRKLFWRHDGHLNVYGNEVISDPLYHFMVDHASRRGG